jgi:hypothetical protein
LAKKISLGISLPEGLYDWVKSRAGMNCRSFAREIQFLLEAAKGAELNEQLERLRAYATIESMAGEIR